MVAVVSQVWLGRRSKNDERQINRLIKNVSRFKGKLEKMIEDAGSKYDGYSISPKIRQILLHWCYELTGKDIFNDFANQGIKMSYYQFNRQEILQKAKERYSKEKAAEYYLQNKRAIKKSQEIDTKTCQRKKKTRLKSTKEKDISN